MLVGLMGKMGAGKTLSMSVLGTYIHKKTGVPLHANYSLQDSSPITSLKQLWTITEGIICFDEMWLTMDSRLWSNNVALTRWINQTRKKKLLVLYTTQHINQIELRARKATDVLIYCMRSGNDITLQFIDYQYSQMGRRYQLNRPDRFYGLYDTYEVLKPIAMSKEDNVFNGSKY